MGQSLRIDRTTAGPVTMLTMFGTIDESFNGAKMASIIRGNKLVIDLREVRRFASWGMAEWMNFLRAAAAIDLYFVECSAYAVQQMNLVSGLLGHGKLVSFFAPVRCNSCSEEFDTLILLGDDRAVVDTEKIQRPCPTCGGTAQMAKDRTDLLTMVAKRPAFDIDDDVVGFLRSRFKYEIVPNTNRFRAYRKEKGAFTYLRMSGNLSTLPAKLLAESARGTTVVDLAGVTCDQSGVDAWRAFAQEALVNVTTLQLLDCPPGFVRDAVDPEHLKSKLKVRTFFLRCQCAGCEATSTVLVDVAENLEQLNAGVIPDYRCKVCNAGLRGDIDPTLLRQLPARERDVALDGFLAKARAEPNNKLEDGLVARPTKAKPTSSIARSAFIGSTLAAIVVGGAFVGLYLWKREPAPAPTVAERPAGGGPGSQSAFRRPDWVLSDAPMSSFCNEQASRLVCVGVSSANPNRDDAVVEATDAAVEELVNVVGLKIVEPWFRTNTLPAYTGVRAKALTKLQDAQTSDQSPKLVAAADVVRKARHRVVEILQASGGPAVPAQRSDWYWEEYANEKGTGTEFLVFVRYDIAADTVTALANTYSTITPIGGGAVMTAFPSLAWQFDDFAGGAIITKAESELDTLGVKAQQLVIALGDQRVMNAESFASRLAATSGTVKLTIKSQAVAARVVELRR